MMNLRKYLLEDKQVHCRIITEQEHSQPQYQTIRLTFDKNEQKYMEIFLRDVEEVDHIIYADLSITKEVYRIEYPKMTDNISDEDMDKVKESIDKELKNLDISLDKMIEFVVWFSQNEMSN